MLCPDQVPAHATRPTALPSSSAASAAWSRITAAPIGALMLVRARTGGAHPGNCRPPTFQTPCVIRGDLQMGPSRATDSLSALARSNQVCGDATRFTMSAVRFAQAKSNDFPRARLARVCHSPQGAPAMSAARDFDCRRFTLPGPSCSDDAARGLRPSHELTGERLFGPSQALGLTRLGDAFPQRGRNCQPPIERG